MKKIMLLLLAVFFVYLLHAQDKTIKVPATYEKIVAGENIKLVLTEADPGELLVKGKKETQITVRDGVLFIKKADCCKPGNITVYVPVKHIKSIELNDGASAYSRGQLQSGAMTVYVKGTSYFDLKSTGFIKVVYDPAVELDIRKVRNEKLLTIAAE